MPQAVHGNAEVKLRATIADGRALYVAARLETTATQPSRNPVVPRRRSRHDVSNALRHRNQCLLQPKPLHRSVLNVPNSAANVSRYIYAEDQNGMEWAGVRENAFQMPMPNVVVT